MSHEPRASGFMTPLQTETGESVADIDRRTMEAAGEAGREALAEAASFVAQTEVSDAVVNALNAYGGTLEDLHRSGGPAPAAVSRLANGRMGKKGATVATLARIALAMDKTLHISIE